MSYTQEQMAEVRKTYPGLTDEQVIEALDRAERARAKRKARSAKTKEELVAKGGQLPVGAEQSTTPTPKPVAEAVAVARMSEADFILRAIRKLRKPPFKGIHTRYSGFNRAFKSYFGVDPILAVGRAHERGDVVMRLCKGGAMVYLPGEAPASGQSDALGQILAD